MTYRRRIFFTDQQKNEIWDPLQAMEAIKWITGAGKPLIGRLLLYDGLEGEFRTLRYGGKG